LIFKIIPIYNVGSSEDKKLFFTDLEASKKIGNQSTFMVQFFGALHVKSSFWLIQELMDTSLDKVQLKSTQLKLQIPTSFLARIAYSILNALIDMKKMRLIHRDVKPANILLNRTGEIKLCDFGIVGFANGASRCKSYRGSLIYMAVCIVYFSVYDIDVSKVFVYFKARKNSNG
jgi:mitogen-activated protein kinase kinase 4